MLHTASGKDALAIRFTYLAEHADEFNLYLISLCKQQSLERFFRVTCSDYPYYSGTVRTASAGVSQPLHSNPSLQEVLILSVKHSAGWNLSNLEMAQ